MLRRTADESIPLQLATAIERREPVALATVVQTRRSVPRRAGAKMLVFADGSTTGTVGGGEMESRVISLATDALRTGTPQLLNYSLVNPASGDPGVCGGDVDIYVEPYMPQSTLLILGAGHVGQAVAEAAAWLDHRTIVWDDRSEFAASADTGTTLTGDLAAALANNPIDAQTAVVIVTRNVALDLEILPVILASNASYIGLMGSNRRWETTRNALQEQGLTAEQLDRVNSPIGVEIGAETPQEIAVSILAEVIRHARGA